ncbi:LacI family DNA-binding transcriptional regulator [Rhodospirillaceae bacterium KN72]|uniref:LacI family DNA-binding transcriptional regulator n=1 Tax=Pacificispira spongiicola TaxID=2729598 RepID=A0A7Y0HFQ5_9PROT|nr:LacI family DNA-binding transcriptional regulator [Pacificispira spongiicola]NMM46085.1 LacI family DNA-binding transcriptional regulator [Pacificispira spongiicola]
MVKPTVHDIAKEAGVSLATVDRVLNARPGVREKTIAKVQAAVEKIGYVRDTNAANLARQKLYRFAFVLPEGPSQFTDTVKAGLGEVVSSQLVDRVAIKVLTVPSYDPHAVVRSLQTINAARYDGVALMVPETPQIRDAISHLKEEGLAVVTMVSDLPHSTRDYFVGVNSIAAGRTAGLLMGRFLPGGGEVLVVTNSLRSRDSLERRLGFDAVVAEGFPKLSVLPTVESFDDPARLPDVIKDVVKTRPNLVGVYSMGFGNTAVLSALRETGRLSDLTVIMHELTPAVRQALVDNEVAAVITQNVGHLVRSAIRVLRGLCDQQPIYDAQERIRIEIVLRENLPY